ncbi:MAG: hypothetical protein V7603_4002 [Micromonosporaceae bacterium]
MNTQRIGRAEVLAMLGSYRSRAGEVDGSAPETLDSLELAWLLHQVAQRYGRHLDLDDDQLALMSTVDGAVDVLGEAGSR